MQFKSYVLAIAAALLGSSYATAQEASDLFRMSQDNYSFSTARSAGMGGAFTSLGGDGISSILNPAGLGMYRSSDMGITVAVLGNRVNADATGPNGTYSTMDNVQSFALNNMSAILNVYDDGANVLRGVTLGISVNKLNDYTSNKYISGHYQQNSMLDAFATDLGYIDPSYITSSSSNKLSVYQDNSPSIWGGMLAYNTGLLSYDSSYEDYWLGNTLFSGDEIYPDLLISTTGGKEISDFSMGFNLLDKIFLGFSIGAENFNYSSTSSYIEFANLDYNEGDLDYFEYLETLNMNGSGLSLKVGATAEVLPGLKVGVAYHSPTYYEISEEYYADMYTSLLIDGDNYFEALTPYLINDYSVSTAPSLLLGVSYVIGSHAVVSIDYDRVYYSRMKIRKADYGQGDINYINNSVTETYSDANNLRVGAEVRLTDMLYFRGGYAIYGNAEKDIDGNSYNSLRNISGGLGIKVNGVYVDFTYVNMQTKSPETYFFSRDYSDGSSLVSENSYMTKERTNNFIFTLGTRF